MLPLDVVENILEYLDDLRDMRTCALVHSSWTAKCQRCLFRDLVVGARDTRRYAGAMWQWKRLCTTLRNSIHLREYPRVLTLKGDWANQHRGYISNYSELAALLPRLASVVIDAGYGGCGIDIILGIPSLLKVQASDQLCSPARHRSAAQDLHPPVRHGIRLLDIALRHPRQEELEWLLETGIVGDVETVSLGCTGDPHLLLPSIRRFLEVTSGSLRVLTLEAPSSPETHASHGTQLSHFWPMNLTS
jgi:hypothetical protein